MIYEKTGTGEDMRQRIVYICNGEIPDCRKTGCVYLSRGECEHTTKEQYAAKEEHRFIRLSDGTLWETKE